MSEQHQEEIDERAAILEYDGGMKRKEAERQARAEITIRVLNGTLT